MDKTITYNGFSILLASHERLTGGFISTGIIHDPQKKPVPAKSISGNKKVYETREEADDAFEEFAKKYISSL